MAVPPEPTTNNPSTPGGSQGIRDKLPTSSHRLPTVSASDALRDLSDDNDHPPSNVYTEIPEVDDALGGGFECGKVTELWGPPGAGKTALALKAASSVLRRGDSVVWIDTSQPLSTHRAHAALAECDLTSFHHYTTPTLAHLLVLLQHQPASFPLATSSSSSNNTNQTEETIRSPVITNENSDTKPPTTTTNKPTPRLLILTSLHTLLEASNPRNPTTSSTTTTTTTTTTTREAQKRRYALLSTLSTTLNRLAAQHRLSVIVTTGCATRSSGDFGGGAGGLKLVPGVGGSEWEGGVWGRGGVVREFGGRVLMVGKVRGRGSEGLGRVVGFEVAGRGGVACAVRASGWGSGGGEDAGAALPGAAASAAAVVVSPAKGRKRTLEEIADSDEEEEEWWSGLEGDGVLAGLGDDGVAEGEDDGGEKDGGGGGNATTIVLD